MTRILFFSFVAFLFYPPAKLSAQINVDSLRKANQEIMIPVERVLGTWYSNDSTFRKIEFVKDTFELILKPRLQGVNYYRFRINGEMVHVSGTAANWPPYYCILNMVNEHMLEIKFYQYHFSNTYNVFFTRN